MRRAAKGGASGSRGGLKAKSKKRAKAGKKAEASGAAGGAARVRAKAKAKPGAKPMGEVRHEYVRAVHPPAGHHYLGDGRYSHFWHHGLQSAAGERSADGGFPDH